MTCDPQRSRLAQPGFRPPLMDVPKSVSRLQASRGYRRVLVSIAALVGMYIAGAFGQHPTREVRAPIAQESAPNRRGRPEAVQSGDKQEIVGAARLVRRGVVSLVHNGRPIGTGFVISEASRLVVTAGHVADMFFEKGPYAKSPFDDAPIRDAGLYAFFEGAPKSFRVDKVWYHPGVRREFDYGLAARSFDPTDGPIAYPSPDLAVIRLAAESGDLPQGCGVRIQIDSFALDGCSVGVLGFWDVGGRRPAVDGPAPANCLASATTSRESRVGARGSLWAICLSGCRSHGIRRD